MSSSATMGLASSSGASVTTDVAAQDNNNDALDADVELQQAFSRYHLGVDCSYIWEMCECTRLHQLILNKFPDCGPELTKE